MADDFEVRGADDFLKLSKALKHAGRTELRKELNKGLRDAAKPLVKVTRAEALRRLPQRGGLAKQVAKAPQRVQVRTGATTAGVRIAVPRAGRGATAGSSNRGFVRHPVFGNRDVWVTQQVPKGWFDDPLKDSAPKVRPHLEHAIERVASQVVRDAGGR